MRAIVNLHYQQYRKQHCKTVELTEAAVQEELSHPAAMRKLERLDERIRQSSLFTEEQLKLWKMPVKLMEINKMSVALVKAKNDCYFKVKLFAKIHITSGMRSFVKKELKFSALKIYFHAEVINRSLCTYIIEGLRT